MNYAQTTEIHSVCVGVDRLPMCALRARSIVGVRLVSHAHCPRTQVILFGIDYRVGKRDFRSVKRHALREGAEKSQKT